MIGSAEQLYFVIKPRMVNVYNIGMLTNVLSHYTFLCLCKFFRRERPHTVCNIEHFFLILPIYREFLVCICVHFPNYVKLRLIRLIVAGQFIEIFNIEPYMIGSAE